MLKNRKYLAESFAAFKDSKKKKEDPFARDEETDEVDQTEDTEDKEVAESDEDMDDATEEEIEETEEDDELEAEMAESDEDDGDEDGELEDVEEDDYADEDDVEIGEDESDEDAEEEGEYPTKQGFSASANTDMSSMMSGGMNGMTSFKRPEWAITRVMTDNGERIAMEYQTETECEVIVGNLTYTEADTRSTEIANQLNLSAFNSETDKYLGRVSSKVVRKQEGEKKTSYKY